jgi:alpha-glucosidase
MEETTRTGIPLMRPLFLEYPEDGGTYGNDRQFLFGRDLLVAAQLDEMTDSWTLGLPPGEWYDYWTGEKFAAHQVLHESPELEELPLYVRAGAIIPQQPIVQHTDEAPQGPLTLRVYAGEDCEGSLYLDDGKTFDYTRGEYLRIHFACEPSEEGVRITLSAYEGSYKPWWKKVQLEVFGLRRAPREVRVGTKLVTDWLRFGSQGQLMLEIPDTPAADEIRIVY